MILRALVFAAAGLLLPQRVTAWSAYRAQDVVPGQLASAGNPSIELDWTAPPECPDGNAVRADIDRLIGTTVRRSHPLKARVVIRPSAESGWVLELVTDLDGLIGERRLSGASCQSLADAAAVMLALILNPDLALPSSSPSTEPPAAPIAPAIESPAERRGYRRLWRLGAHGGIQTGVIEDMSPSFALSVGVELGQLLLRLMPALTPPQDVLARNQAKVGGRLWLATLAAHGCWAGRWGRIGLSPCVGAEITRLQGHGIGVLSPRETTAYWTSAELAFFAGVPLGRSLLVELAAIGLLPLRRPSVYLDEIAPVSRPAAVGFRGTAGISWIFD